MDFVGEIFASSWSNLAAIVAMAVVVVVVFMSFWNIGPTEVGLVRKRFSLKRLRSGSPVALHGEAGYQANLLTTGLRFKLWPLFTVIILSCRFPPARSVSSSRKSEMPFPSAPSRPSTSLNSVISRTCAHL